MDAKTFDNKRLTGRHVTTGPRYEPQWPCGSGTGPIIKSIGHLSAAATTRRSGPVVRFGSALQYALPGEIDRRVFGNRRNSCCANSVSTGSAMAQTRTARASKVFSEGRAGSGWKTEINLFEVAETAIPASYIAGQTSGKQAHNLTSTHRRDPQCGTRTAKHARDDMGTARGRFGPGVDVNYARTGGASGDCAATRRGRTMEKICYADQ